MRRPCADREEKRVTHGKDLRRERQLDLDNPNQSGLSNCWLERSHDGGGDGPDEGREFARNRDGDDIGRLAGAQEAPVAGAHASGHGSGHERGRPTGAAPSCCGARLKLLRRDVHGHGSLDLLRARRLGVADLACLKFEPEPPSAPIYAS